MYQDLSLAQSDEIFNEQDAIEQIKSSDDVQNWLNGLELENDYGFYDGEKNTLFNPAFAPFLLNLCKTIFLWSAVNAKFFHANKNANSTANVESYFKDVKTSLKDKIPCRVDEFLAEHIDMINGMTIDASQDYVEFVNAAGGLAKFREAIQLNECEIEGNETSFLDELTENFNNEGTTNDLHDDDSQLSGSEKNENRKNTSDTTLDENIHNQESDSCVESSSIVNESETSAPSQNENLSLATSTPNRNIRKNCTLSMNLNEKEKWSKQNRGKGKFLHPMPYLRLMTSEKKVPKIGFIRNASLSTVTYKINGKNVKLKNTCGIDSLVQVI